MDGAKVLHITGNVNVRHAALQLFIIGKIIIGKLIVFGGTFFARSAVVQYCKIIIESLFVFRGPFSYGLVRKETRASSPISIIVFRFFHVMLALQLRAERGLRSYGDHLD
uniref:Uncharacterized protein n=1 Tax=Romanomermis culicivorax TaxID=13658 RepID=A0A915KTY9_ROMCU